MDEEKRGIYGNRLPEASNAFEQAILRGGEDIRRYERRRRRVSRLTMAAAAVVLIALGLGAALTRLNAPKPDNTVLSVDPQSVVTDAEKARLRAAETPRPTQTPEPEEEGERSRIDPETGWEYLLDDGPFEEGEWLVLTETDGSLDYGIQMPFLELPTEDARFAGATVGMMVKYLGAAENGYAQVEFAGQPGYVYGKNLRRGACLPALTDGDYELDEAMLYMTDRWGHVHGQYIINADNDRVRTYALQKLLESLVPVDPADYEGEAFSGVLVAQMWNPDDPVYEGHLRDKVRKTKALRFNLPRSGRLVLMAEDGRMYSVGEADAALFRSIFDEVYAEASKDE